MPAAAPKVTPPRNAATILKAFINLIFKSYYSTNLIIILICCSFSWKMQLYAVDRIELTDFNSMADFILLPLRRIKLNIHLILV